MQVVALEKNPGRHARLVEAMRPFSEHVPRIAHVRCTTLHDRVDALMKHVRQRPVLFFLDPFGVDGLVVKDLPKLLSGPQNEVFSLFSDTGAHRLYATLRTQDRNVAFEVAKVEEQPFLFADLTAAEVQTVREQSERRNAALRATQAGALRILEAALSAERLDALRSVPDDEVPYRATELWMDSLVAAGARYVFSIPVRDSRNQHVYRLVYATKSAAGSEAMKHALQAALNSSTLPTEVREGIRRELMMNAGDVVRELEGRFQGQRVGWIEKVRPYLLTETPLLPDQITLIRRELERRDYTFSRKPFAFSFPPTRPPVPRSRDTDSTPAP